MERLAESHVAVFGPGGVGSYAVEGLVRSGVGRLTLVDFDLVCITNCNRQIQAIARTVGQSKADLLAARCREVNPAVQVRGIREFYCAETSDRLLADSPDVVLDAIDNITAMLHLLHARCKSCHNPTGMASTMTHVGLHFTDGEIIGCGKCHEPHNVEANSGPGAGPIRANLTFKGSTPAVYPSGGPNPFVTGDPAAPGLCEACHTRTAYFRADGTGDNTHNPDVACTNCHVHEDGFGTTAFNGGHYDETAEA